MLLLRTVEGSLDGLQVVLGLCLPGLDVRDSGEGAMGEGAVGGEDLEKGGLDAGVLGEAEEESVRLDGEMLEGAGDVGEDAVGLLDEPPGRQVLQVEVG